VADGHKGFGDLLDSISIGVGRAASWLTLLMVIVTVIIVVLRYVFGTGLIWLQESLTWMHAVVFMLGAAYTLQQEQHVRVDIFYCKMTDKHRAWVDFLGVLVFIFPICAVLVYTSMDYVAVSWAIGEVSRNSGGLPYPFVPLLKSVLIIMPVAVALQGLSLLLRSAQIIRER